ncbi:MAG: hypothetical protein R6V41_08440 [Desulfobacteraceae bacterium]
MDMDKGFFEKLEALYSKMDRKWSAAARHYGFECSGCEDNCCRSLFFHHTFIEEAFLLVGFEALSGPDKRYCRQQARQYLDTVFTQEGGVSENRPFCPLNIKGLCAVYPNRPMICRLHGIPHHLEDPAGRIVKGDGCAEGRDAFLSGGYFDFNRTPFYSKMAVIEMEYRKAEGLSGKNKKTVAHMIAQV